MPGETPPLTPREEFARNERLYLLGRDTTLQDKSLLLEHSVEIEAIPAATDPLVYQDGMLMQRLPAE